MHDIISFSTLPPILFFATHAAAYLLINLNNSYILLQINKFVSKGEVSNTDTTFVVM